MTGIRKAIVAGGLTLSFVLAWGPSGYGEGSLLAGTDLDELCGGQDTHSDRDLLCNTYVHGFLDGFNTGASLATLRLGYCPPKNLTVAIGRLAIAKYLRDHPTELGLDAGTIAARAVLSAFPCPDGSN
ncbi:hypothetical protein SAMN05519103_01756 [Rhizobiales bacterium GAS113]|nr:hypothetical protein SAMN05519103_01756 [Rhizobiales bacterium GAS113]